MKTSVVMAMWFIWLTGYGLLELQIRMQSAIIASLIGDITRLTSASEANSSGIESLSHGLTAAAGQIGELADSSARNSNAIINLAGGRR